MPSPLSCAGLAASDPYDHIARTRNRTDASDAQGLRNRLLAPGWGRLCRFRIASCPGRTKKLRDRAWITGRGGGVMPSPLSCAGPATRDAYRDIARARNRTDADARVHRIC